MSKGKKELSIEDFQYVDVWHKNPQTDFSTKWQRVEVGAMADFAQKYNNYNVFATVQRYKNKARNDSGNEPMYAPLFFDIDSDRTLVTNYEKNKVVDGLVELGTISPSEAAGVVPQELAAHLHNLGLGIDLTEDICNTINQYVETNAELKEYVWRKNLETSRQDAVKLIHFFKEKFSMTEDECRVYFSGSKGFHVLIHPIVLGIKPEKELHRIFKLVATSLESQLGLRSLDTGSIYGHGRMLRMPNSFHHKSGLVKVELTHEELLGDLQHIMYTLAKAPRQDLYPAEDYEYSTNETAHDWYMGYVQTWNETKRLQTDRVALKDEVLAKMDGVPVCVQFILERGILKSGDRNKATMALASYYKDIGYTMEQTTHELLEWLPKIPKSFVSSNFSEMKASTIGCVKTVYTDEKYHFGCAFIRSLSGERVGRDYETVPCAGRVCPAHEDYSIDQEPAETMHLAQTADAEFTGKKVGFKALVSGKMDTPFIVPKKVRYVCAHQPFCDKDCIMHDYEGLYEREFHENERFLIEAVNQNDAQTKGILFHHSGASCKKVRSEVLENANVTELLVVPMADRVKTLRDAEGNIIGEVDGEGKEYVSRKIYAVGKPDDIPKANDHYEIEGFVYSHPKNAMATILTQKHQQLEDSVSKFTMDAETVSEFKRVFQVQAGETLDDRISVLHQDIVSNVTQVHERFEAHLGVLLTYHSCLHYLFQGRLEKRGWMETILVGDSGRCCPSHR